ncbi:MAG: DnaD domain protein [Candidatus Fimenecus sp.]
MYKINPNCYSDVCVFPRKILQKNFKLANHTFLKVLIFVFLNPSLEINAHNISDNCKISLEQAEEAIEYWINENAFCDDSELSIAKIEDAHKIENEIKQENIDLIKTAEIKKPTQTDINQRLDESEEFGMIVDGAQNLLGRTIGLAMSSVLLNLYDDYGLPFDVIMTLIKFGVDNGNTSTSYILKTGKLWSEKGIYDVSSANEMIVRLGRVNRLFNELKQFTGISIPKPTRAQSEYLESWINKGIGIDLIVKAYEIAAEKTGKINFNYMNKVIMNWYDKGFNTPEDVENAKLKSDRRFANEKNASFDTALANAMAADLADLSKLD